jgi:hypothetical protein
VAHQPAVRLGVLAAAPVRLRHHGADDRVLSLPAGQATDPGGVHRSTAARLGISGEGPAGWLPVPLLPAALITTALWRLRDGELAAAAAGGAVFGLVSQLVWPSVGPLVGAALGAPFGALGALAGARLALVLLHPRARGCTILALVALAMPFVSGIADLYLRVQTP